MDNDWLEGISKDFSPTDTVVVAIKNRWNRKHISEGFRKLGDTVLDWYSETPTTSFALIFSVPHRLMVIGYRDFRANEAAILLHLSRADNPIKPILIYGRKWRKIPEHQAIVDGDDLSPDEICRMFWDARGSLYIPANTGGSI